MQYVYKIHVGQFDEIYANCLAIFDSPPLMGDKSTKQSKFPMKHKVQIPEEEVVIFCCKVFIASQTK